MKVGTPEKGPGGGASDLLSAESNVSAEDRVQNGFEGLGTVNGGRDGLASGELARADLLCGRDGVQGAEFRVVKDGRHATSLGGSVPSAG